MIVPEITELTAPYWEGARLGALRLQRCDVCNRVWHPPLPTCPACGIAAVRWFDATGSGHIHSTTIVHQAAHPAVAENLPYLVALVQLSEGPLVVMNVLGADPATVKVGDAVRIVFQPLGDDIVLPQAELAGPAGLPDSNDIS